MVDHQDVILTDNRHPEDQMMRVIGAESLEMIVVLGMIVAPAIAMIEEVLEISEDPEMTVDPEMIVEVLEISEDPEMTVDPEMIVDLEEMIEEVIEVVTIGDLDHLEGEIVAEPAILLEEMIVEEVDSVEEVIEIVIVEIVIVEETAVVIVELMIGDLLPVLCLQQETIDEMIAGMIVILRRQRLPSVIKVGRKLILAMVG